MEGSEGSPPQSLCMIRAAELFPKPPMEKEDSDLAVPFQELPGESVKYLGRTDDGVLALSNYRLFLLKDSTNSETSVPLGLIESVQLRDLFHLIINCKDASTVKCSFETAEQCAEWQRRIQLSVGVPETLESLFAFPFYSWTCDTAAATNGTGNTPAITSNGSAFNGVSASALPSGFYDSPPYMPAALSLLQADASDRLQRASRYEDDFMREVERLRFDLNGSWRVSHANDDFKLCPSYPQKILVPICIPDEMLHGVANFRGSRRLPAVVWRHQRSGAVIARSSQPEVGWLGWRNAKDEQLLKALADACAFDRGELQRRLTNNHGGSSNNTATTIATAAAAAATTTTHNTQTTSAHINSSSSNSTSINNITTTNPSSDSAPSSPDGSHEEVALDEIRKVLIVDARSYTSAVTNRARGGGCECIEYYPSAEIEFMNLGNIHVIRKSFHALRQLCASPSDIPNWLGLLEKTMWLQHLSGLLAASMTVCHAIENKGRPVLVHCSDGWDRTPQIVATAQLCLDPYYRTVEGFRILVEREWLSYGHKFSDRCGHGPGSDELNERCPVFLQWLDLVHQIHKQFPCSFEFSMGYLIKLAQHSLSCLFGTFLCNTLKERIENSVFERTFSVWPFLSGPMYRNPLYIANKERVLWPAHNVRDLYLWTEVYLGSLGNKSGIEFSACNIEGGNGSINPMAKTRSYGDLISAGLYQNGMSRRSSDPNMSVDPNLLVSSESENNSIADMPPAEGISTPDVIASIIHDTTRKLQDLTTELNNHDDEDFKSAGSQTNAYNFSEQPTETCGILSNGSCHAFGNTQMAVHENGCEEKQTALDCDPCRSSRRYVNALCGDLRENGVSCAQQDGECTVDGGAGITGPKTYNLNIDLMQSVDLGDSLKDSAMSKSNGFTPSSLTTTTTTTTTTALTSNGSYTEAQFENMWHGSVNTSTDTLVPIECRQQQQQQCENLTQERVENVDQSKTLVSEDYKPDCDTTDGVNLKKSMENGVSSSNEEKTSTKLVSSCNILPKIHNSPSTTATMSHATRNGTMSKSLCSDAAVPPTAALQQDIEPAIEYTPTGGTLNVCANLSSKPNPMEESIMILPEHPKLEISISGKCETVASSDENGVINPTKVLPPFYTMGGSRRRRTSSSNSNRYDSCGGGRQPQPQLYHNGSTISRISLPSVRSLPMTPPGLPERPQIAISCPDGLAHALSEQNIRLQQIVHEHKLREDVLLRELHDMRMALLKRTCPNCNNAATSNDEQVDEIFDTNDSDSLEFITHKHCCARCRATCRKHKELRHSCRHHQHHHPHNHHHHRRRHQQHNHRNRHHHTHCCRRQRHRKQIDDDDDDDDDQVDVDEDESDICDCGSSSPISACSGMDNVENSSICSWEAVEDRSGASSCTSSTIQPNNATSVLWVPDHAVSRCTSCQTEFWLGRRKHHCRSCGQIFCADCSEFWAPLPDIKLFSAVRLCGPCYHTVTTRMQESASAIVGSNGISQFQHAHNNPLLQLQQTMAKSVTANAMQSVVSATTAAAAVTTSVACVAPTATATTTKA